MYSNLIKDAAFTLDCSGFSPNGIAAKLRERFKVKLTGKTVKEWIDEPDWQARKSQVVVTSEKSLIHGTANMREEVLKGTRRAFERLRDSIETVDGKTLEGVSYALKSISEFLLKLEDGNFNIEDNALIGILLEVLNEFSEVRAAIEKNWEDIHRRLKEKSREYMKNKTG
jgi:hypothetical protein